MPSFGHEGKVPILFVGIGGLLLVLGVNQFVWQRWFSAVAFGIAGLCVVLAGVFLPRAALTSKTMVTFLRILLRTIVFAATVAVVAVSVDRATSEFIGISLPCIAALWLLALGARFASRRASVIAISAFAGLFLLLQCAILGIVIPLSAYHSEHRMQHQLLLAAVVVSGVFFIGWFIRAKLPHAGRRS